MKQFDVYVNTNKDTNKTYPYFVDVQNSMLDSLNSRVVIPLTPMGKPNKNYPDNLCPVIEIMSKKFALLTHQITSVSTNFLKKQEGTMLDNKDELVEAIDFLISGI